MIGLQTIAVAFAMFSALPVPQFAWNQKNMRYAMCAFPLIGAVIGGLWCLCGALPLPRPAKAAGFCLIPVWVTGGIHLDGYADTCDALSSYGDREKKLEILKDPHCGAFAVIRLCSYFAAYLALCACVDFTPRVGLCWTLALVLERALSGLAVASFPMAKNTGLAHTFATAADRTTVRRVLMVLAALLSAALLALGGWALVLAALLVFARYHVVSGKQFGGITGDLAGWFCRKPSCGCWRRCVPASGEDCYDLYHRAAVQRQAHLCAAPARHPHCGGAGPGSRGRGSGKACGGALRL